jgi:hypothetical protein
MCTGHRAQRVRCLGVTHMGLRRGGANGLGVAIRRVPEAG